MADLKIPIFRFIRHRITYYALRGLCLMDCLVTGGAGFMGSHVARELSERNHEILILDDLSGGFKDNVPENILFVQGSINDQELISSLFEENDFGAVFHLAAYAAEGLSPFLRRFNYKNNLIGSVNLINESVKNDVEVFVFTSSIAVYGDQSLPYTESDPTDPIDPYGIAKDAVEKDLRNAHQQWGLDYIIFRPHNVYGEHQNYGDPYRNVVGIFINQVLRNQPLTIFGDGEQTRSFTHIDDVAPVMADSIFNSSARNEIFNIGSDEEYSVNELAEIVLETMYVDNDIRYLPERHEVKHAHASHEKIKNYFDYNPTMNLPEGVNKMVEWVRQATERSGRDFDEFEIEEGLPPNWK